MAVASVEMITSKKGVQPNSFFAGYSSLVVRITHLYSKCKIEERGNVPASLFPFI